MQVQQEVGQDVGRVALVADLLQHHVGQARGLHVVRVEDELREDGQGRVDVDHAAGGVRVPVLQPSAQGPGLVHVDARPVVVQGSRGQDGRRLLADLQQELVLGVQGVRRGDVQRGPHLLPERCPALRLPPPRRRRSVFRHRGGPDRHFKKNPTRYLV